MPHYGISWFRLKEHFRKYLAIYIVGVVICVLLTNLVYTSTAPQTPYDQEVLIYLADVFTDTEPLDDLAADALAYAQEFDETLLEVNFESLQYVDPEQDYTSSMLLMDEIDEMVGGNNVDLVLNTIGWMTQQDDGISIRPKTTSSPGLRLTAAQATVWGGIYIIALPVLVLVLGIIVCVKRRKQQ